MKRISENDREAAYKFNRAMDSISEAQQRLSFLLECAPFTSTADLFTREGINGMGFMVGDMVQSLKEAQQSLQKLAQEEKLWT